MYWGVRQVLFLKTRLAEVPGLWQFVPTRTHNPPVDALPNTIAPETLHRVIRIQALTLIWMSAEAVVSLGAAWAASSPALLSFGGDSAVELIPHEAHADERAARSAGVLLFVLAAVVAVSSALALAGLVEPRPSLVGMALLILAAVVMPWLAGQKRELSAATGSAALRADAAESAVCGYLALIALAGLTANAVWGVKWADPVAALALIPFILHEGWEAMNGKPCRDADGV